MPDTASVCPASFERLDASRRKTHRRIPFHLGDPYIQNFNVSIQRELARTLTSERLYVRDQKARGFSVDSLNATDIFKNKFPGCVNVTGPAAIVAWSIKC